MTTTTSADVNRSLTAGAITIGATTSSLNDVMTKASAKGESQDSDGGKKADTQSNDQVKNNPNTNGKTGGDLPKSNDSASQGNGQASSQSGSQGGGVGVAAGVSVNWIRGTNTASVGSGVTLTGSGAVKVSAELETGATAKAIAVAFDLSLSGSDARIAAAVGFNYTDVHNTALVKQDAQVSGNGITVEAVMPAGKENDFVALGASAAGGKTKAERRRVDRHPGDQLRHEGPGRAGRAPALGRRDRRSRRESTIGLQIVARRRQPRAQRRRRRRRGSS